MISILSPPIPPISCSATSSIATIATTRICSKNVSRISGERRIPYQQFRIQIQQSLVNYSRIMNLYARRLTEDETPSSPDYFVMHMRKTHTLKILCGYANTFAATAYSASSPPKLAISVFCTAVHNEAKSE